MRPTLSSIIADAIHVLTFRRPSPAIAQHWPAYLAFGLVFTWLAGIGRYWDNPRADLWQHLGLGSLAYVFSLALILWILLLPLRPRLWSYRNVLVFVTLTSPPAILYAIPVEKFMSLEGAQSANAWFTIVVATLLPLALIVVALAALNLEHVVFELMSGIRPEDRSPNDISYSIVTILAFFSFLASPFLVAAYLWLVYHARPA